MRQWLRTITTPNQKKLEKMIQQGKWPFIYWRGLVAGGLGLPCLYSLLDLLTEDAPFWETFQRVLLISPVLGLIAGVISWRTINKQYAHLKLQEIGDSSNTRQGGTS